MKSLLVDGFELAVVSLPVRGAWIEIIICYSIFPDVKSLPVRGAWIEMTIAMRRLQRQQGRSPCGERGLKLHASCICVKPFLSLPVRGAWIEMDIRRRRETRAVSLPVRGAWIEIR